ncbi:MAG: hypothetical protein IPL09_03835 [Bacteroidetes bacterium]|nr:hypothetical protein [Bacteroidota bacterium]
MSVFPFDPTQIYNTQLFMVNAFLRCQISKTIMHLLTCILASFIENDNKISSIEMSVLKDASINDVQKNKQYHRALCFKNQPTDTNKTRRFILF